jgi:uncharacterized membrane protein YoaK (UPF0700 family)
MIPRHERTAETEHLSAIVNGSPVSESDYSESRSLRFAAQRQEWLAAGLAMIAGFVDAYGIITYKTYVSFMSGNTTQAGYRIGQGDFGAVIPPAIAIVSFVSGTLAGALLAHSALRQTRRLVFGLVATSLALVISSTQLGLLSVVVHIAVVSLAMGLMTTAMSHVGAQSVNVTFLTGPLTRLGSHLALALRRASLSDSEGSWDTHWHRTLVLARVYAGFLGGALLSGAATPRFGVWVLLLPLLILSVLMASDRTESAAV